MIMNEDRLSGSFLYSIVLKALQLTEKSKTQTALKGEGYFYSPRNAIVHENIEIVQQNIESN